jgi:hypothetical protein
VARSCQWILCRFPAEDQAVFRPCCAMKLIAGMHVIGIRLRSTWPNWQLMIHLFGLSLQFRHSLLYFC